MKPEIFKPRCRRALLPSAMWCLVWLNGFSAFPGAEAAPSPLKLGVNLSHSLSSEKIIKKVFVGNSKILRAREVSPRSILLTGLSPGRTSLRLLDATSIETAYEVLVIAPDETVKVSLEFIEVDAARGMTSGIRLPDIIQGTGAATLLGDGSISGLNYVFSFNTARGWIEFMRKQGWARIIANPDLYVRLGEVATFHSGGEFPVPTTSESYGRYLRHIEWKTFGLTVRVKPQSPDNYRIGSEIHVAISELDRSSAVEGVPALTQRRLDTKIDSVDGETVILSGLVRQASGKENQGVPGLSDIPIFGAFFSRTETRWERSELLMAITFDVRSRALDDRRRENFKKKFNEAPNDPYRDFD